MGELHSRRAKLSMNERRHGTERQKEGKGAVCRGRNCEGAHSMREQLRGLEKRRELAVS